MAQLEGVQTTTANDSSFSTNPHRGFTAKTSEFDDGLSAFHAVRRKLFGTAYRMLRSAAEAEDVIQDVWLRWQTTNRSDVLDPPAFMMTITIRMCINLCRSARSRRETSVGTWLSEPIDNGADPCQGAERMEALKSAVLMLLEKLRPAERAAYVLREAFDYSSRQIAEVLQLKETNVRQLLTRARRHIAKGRRAWSSSAEQRRLLAAFAGAAESGNLAELECLFAPHASFETSGGNSSDTRNQDSMVNQEHFAQTLTWCHKTTGYSVLSSTAASCEGLDDNLSEMEISNIDFLPVCGLLSTGIACE